MTNKLFSEDTATDGDFDLLDSPTGDVERPANYLEALVGEGKKFKTQEDVARSVWEKDNVFIPQVLRENKELRRELQERANLEQLVKELKNSSASNSAPNSESERPEDNPGRNNQNSNAPSKEDIASLVKSIVTEEKTQDARTRNIEFCVSELRKNLGDGYEQVLKARAKDLGLSKDYLDNLAATSPKALLALVVPPRSKEDVKAPRSSILTTNKQVSNSNTKDWAYYQNLRKQDPRRYFSAEVQLEIDRRAANGELDIPSY